MLPLPLVISFSPQSRSAKVTLVRVTPQIGFSLVSNDTPDKICDQVSDAIVSCYRFDNSNLISLTSYVLPSSMPALNKTPRPRSPAKRLPRPA